MKRIFQYISVCLLLVVTGTSCEDNDNWRIISTLQEGVYVAGDATVYSATASAAALGTIYLDPADQVAPGISGIYTWLKGSTPFYLISVDAETNQTQLGGGSEVTMDGAEGKTYAAVENGTLSVDHDGFYCIIYNSADHQISIVEYVMVIIGDATPGKWDTGTPMGAPVYTEATSIVTYSMTGVALNNKEIKFRVGSNWQFKIPYGTGSLSIAAGYGPESAMDLTEASSECMAKAGLPNYKISKAGLYDIMLTYELRSKKFMAKAVYKGENPDQPAVTLPEKMYAIGDFCGWSWDNAPELIPVNSHEGTFWGIYYMEAGNGFKFNNDKDWNGNEFGAENEDPRGYGEVPVGGSNIKVQNAGFYQVLVTCSLSADKSSIEKKIELLEPAIYLMGGTAPDNTWSGPVAVNKFTLQSDLYVSPATVAAGELRMFVELPGIAEWQWWQSEFIILEGKIAYRGSGGDQARVNVSAGQVVKLNFKDNTGSIE